MGNICVQGGKIEAVKVFGPSSSINFFQDFRSITYYPKTVDAYVPGDSITVLLKMFGN